MNNAPHRYVCRFYTDEGSRDELFQNNVGTRTKCAGHHQHYGTDNVLINNIYYHVNIGDVVSPGRKEILMPGHCDATIRASTHPRNPAICHPDTVPTTKPDCCCHPGCDQGKCSSFKFERNVVYQPSSATGIFIGTGFAGENTGNQQERSRSHPVAQGLVSSTADQGCELQEQQVYMRCNWQDVSDSARLWNVQCDFRGPG